MRLMTRGWGGWWEEKLLWDNHISSMRKVVLILQICTTEEVDEKNRPWDYHTLSNCLMSFIFLLHKGSFVIWMSFLILTEPADNPRA
jgi:hypothetical protein